MDYLSTIHTSLARLGATQSNNSLWICCPFHNETKPSMSVSLGGSVVPGTFHCFGCGVSGSWNKLRTGIAGLPEIDQRSLVAEYDATPKSISVLDTDYVVEHFIAKSFKHYIKWVDPDTVNIPMFRQWYGIDGRLLYKIDSYLVRESNGAHRLFLPVIVNKKIVGGIRVARQKKDKVRQYLNTQGRWAEDYGLLMYDLVRNNVAHHNINFIILVEGPRDALRLTNLNFPTIAILGSNNFTQLKADLLLGIRGLDTIYLMPDMDEAGTKMAQLCNKFLKPYIQVKRIKLPATTMVEDMAVATDPYNVDQEVLDDIRHALISRCPAFETYRSID